MTNVLVGLSEFIGSDLKSEPWNQFIGDGEEVSIFDYGEDGIEVRTPCNSLAFSYQDDELYMVSVKFVEATNILSKTLKKMSDAETFIKSLTNEFGEPFHKGPASDGPLGPALPFLNFDLGNGAQLNVPYSASVKELHISRIKRPGAASLQ